MIPCVKSVLVLNQIHVQYCCPMQVSTPPKASLQEIYEGTQVHTGDSRSTKVQIQSLFRAVWTLPSIPAASRETACACSCLDPPWRFGVDKSSAAAVIALIMIGGGAKVTTASGGNGQQDADMRKVTESSGQDGRPPAKREKKPSRSHRGGGGGDDGGG